MPTWSRRRFLSAATASLTAAVAGCQDSAGPQGPRPQEQPVEDYETRQVRNTDGVALFTEGESIPTASETGRVEAFESLYAVSSESLAEVTFADVPEARTLEGFASDTDFSRRSVYLFSTPVEECYTVELSSVTRDEDGDPSSQFCRSLRPADVACRTGQYHTVGYAIRLPFTKSVNSGYGTGMASDCRGERPLPFDATVTATETGDAS